MAIKKNSKKEVETKEEVKELEITVKRAKDFSDDEKTCIAIDLEVNGVTIYNCWYREGKKKGRNRLFNGSFSFQRRS